MTGERTLNGSLQDELIVPVLNNTDELRNNQVIYQFYYNKTVTRTFYILGVPSPTGVSVLGTGTDPGDVLGTGTGPGDVLGVGDIPAPIGAGHFDWDPADTTSPDNGGTIIVDLCGHRYKRRDCCIAVFNVGWFGAQLDGNTDDSEAIQRTIDALAEVGGGTVLIPSGSDPCICNITPVVSTPNIGFEIQPGAVLDVSHVTPANAVPGPAYPGILFQGSGRGQSSQLTADANSGAISVTVGNPAVFKLGDWVQITSNDLYPSTSVRFGQLLQVALILGTTIQFTSQIAQQYRTAAGARLYKLGLIEGNFVRGGGMIIGAGSGNANSGGVAAMWTRGFRCSDIFIKSFALYGVAAYSSVLADIDGVLYDGDTGSSSYGAWLENSAQWNIVRGVRSYRAGGPALQTQSPAEYGEPLDNLIVNNITA